MGGSATGTIETACDHDWFAVELVAGRTYQFDPVGSPGGGGTLRDTCLRAIYDSEGRYQSRSYNDNFGGSRDSRVTFTADEAGTSRRSSFISPPGGINTRTDVEHNATLVNVMQLVADVRTTEDVIALLRDAGA